MVNYCFSLVHDLKQLFSDILPRILLVDFATWIIITPAGQLGMQFAYGEVRYYNKDFEKKSPKNITGLSSVSKSANNDILNVPF